MKRFSLVLTFFLVIALGIPASAGEVVRVKNLYVENGASPYFEVVAFGPGSGWVRINSPEVMRPMLNLDKVNPVDLRRLNGYAKRYGLPVKAEISVGILYLVKNDTDISFLAGTKRLEQNLYWEPEEQPRLAIIKDDSGKIFVVKRAIDIRTAKKHPKKKSFHKKKIELKAVFYYCSYFF